MSGESNGKVKRGVGFVHIEVEFPVLNNTGSIIRGINVVEGDRS